MTQEEDVQGTKEEEGVAKRAEEDGDGDSDDAFLT